MNAAEIKRALRAQIGKRGIRPERSRTGGEAENAVRLFENLRGEERSGRLALRVEITIDMNVHLANLLCSFDAIIT